MLSRLLLLVLTIFIPDCLFFGCSSHEFTVVAGGDVTLARNPGRLLVQEGSQALFAKVKDQLAADFSVVNLECALTSNFERQLWAGPKEPILTLKAPLTSAQALSGIFDAVSLANNHSLDAGEDGLGETIQALNRFGIGHAGAGFGGEALEPFVFDKNSQKVVFLAFSQPFPELISAAKRVPIAIAQKDSVIKAIKRARITVSDGLVIVSFHWGQEGETAPNATQRDLARSCIDAGANAVLGHHSHSLQGLERYRKGIIAYSLGNFLFDSGGNDNRQSIIVKMTWSETKTPKVEIIPIWLTGPARVPCPATGMEALQILNDIAAKSVKLGGRLQVRSSGTAFLE